METSLDSRLAKLVWTVARFSLNDFSICHSGRGCDTYRDCIYNYMYTHKERGRRGERRGRRVGKRRGGGRESGKEGKGGGGRRGGRESGSHLVQQCLKVGSLAGQLVLIVSYESH